MDKLIALKREFVTASDQGYFHSTFGLEGRSVTKAICVKCGVIKFGAFTYCPKCNQRPEGEIDLAYSLALTDHYFALDTLNQISDGMQSGRPRPTLPRDQEEKMREGARQYLEKFGEALGLAVETNEHVPAAFQHKIRIHPMGLGRVTDASSAIRLQQIAPHAFRKAQDVLVAAGKYASGPGVFRSKRSLIQKLQQEIYELKKSLLYEKYRPELRDSPNLLLFSFLNEFSDAFPNWQREYAVLNQFIPQCF